MITTNRKSKIKLQFSIDHDKPKGGSVTNLYLNLSLTVIMSSTAKIEEIKRNVSKIVSKMEPKGKLKIGENHHLRKPLGTSKTAERVTKIGKNHFLRKPFG